MFADVDWLPNFADAMVHQNRHVSVDTLLTESSAGACATARRSRSFWKLCGAPARGAGARALPQRRQRLLLLLCLLLLLLLMQRREGQRDGVPPHSAAPGDDGGDLADQRRLWPRLWRLLHC